MPRRLSLSIRVTAALLAPGFAFGKAVATVPDYWGIPDWSGFLVILLLTFTLAIRAKILRTNCR